MQSRDNCKHFQRDYGAILMNRVGRKGYKIHIQVVGILWDFRLLKHFPPSNLILHEVLQDSWKCVSQL